MTRIYLYGIAGASDKFAVIRYEAVDACQRVTDTIKMVAANMREDYPSIETIFMIDARGGLADDYHRAIKQNTVEGFVIFKDILERKGIELKV